MIAIWLLSVFLFDRQGIIITVVIIVGIIDSSMPGCR